jgi:hypothetical protein
MQGKTLMTSQWGHDFTTNLGRFREHMQPHVVHCGASFVCLSFHLNSAHQNQKWKVVVYSIQKTYQQTVCETSSNKNNTKKKM